MLELAWPWMFLLLPLPWVVYFFLLKANVNKAPIINFPKLNAIHMAFVGSKVELHKYYTWRKILLIVIWLCLITALTRPELVKDIAYADNTGYDIMLAVDLSRSMEAVDFSDRGEPISRIAATKKVVSNFVEQRSGDRIGLIVFAEQAYLTIPLTLDTKSVSKMLHNLIVGMAGESTAIGDAIGIGVKNLRKRPPASRVLIVLTDGIDNTSHIPPLEATKIAATDKIKIYTIGVGDKLDDALLKKIADMTGGTYSKVQSVNDLAAVYAQIDRLEKSEAKHQGLLIKTPLYQIFLIIALVGLIILFIIDTKQNRYGYVTSRV